MRLWNQFSMIWSVAKQNQFWLFDGQKSQNFFLLLPYYVRWYKYTSCMFCLDPMLMPFVSQYVIFFKCSKIRFQVLYCWFLCTVNNFCFSYTCCVTTIYLISKVIYIPIVISIHCKLKFMSFACYNIFEYWWLIKNIYVIVGPDNTKICMSKPKIFWRHYF